MTRKFNIWTALFAALALVAIGCKSNGAGGDDTGGTGGSTSENIAVTGKVATYTATLTENDKCSGSSGSNKDDYALSSVAIEFSDGGSATVTIEYYHCGTNSSESHSSTAKVWTDSAHTLFTAILDKGTGWEVDSGKVYISLPSSSNTQTDGTYLSDASNVAKLILTPNSEGTELTLTGTDPDSNIYYRVYGSDSNSTSEASVNNHDGSHGIDLFGNGLSTGNTIVGELTADESDGTTFTLADAS